jgi:hypothetical protein
MKAASTTPSIPGGRAALPEGSLPGPFLGPQGDENRDPPENAPIAPQPATRIDTQDTATKSTKEGETGVQ